MDEVSFNTTEQSKLVVRRVEQSKLTGVRESPFGGDDDDEKSPLSILVTKAFAREVPILW